MARKAKASKAKKQPKTYKGKSTRLGGGGKFQKGVDEMMAKGMSEDYARRVMAKRGMQKYGAGQMMTWAQAGKKRAARKKNYKRPATQ